MNTCFHELSRSPGYSVLGMSPNGWEKMQYNKGCRWLQTNYCVVWWNCERYGLFAYLDNLQALSACQECPFRPIVFIGHCFGGIVIEKVGLLVWHDYTRGTNKQKQGACVSKAS